MTRRFQGKHRLKTKLHLQSESERLIWGETVMKKCLRNFILGRHIEIKMSRGKRRVNYFRSLSEWITRQSVGES